MPSIKFSILVWPCQEGEKIAAVSPFVVLDRLNESMIPLNVLADPSGSIEETISEMTATPASLFREFGAIEACSSCGRLGMCTPPSVSLPLAGRHTYSYGLDACSGKYLQDRSYTITSQDLFVSDVFTIGRPDWTDTDVIGAILYCIFGLFDRRDRVTDNCIWA
jgi:hypothetical protein